MCVRHLCMYVGALLLLWAAPANGATFRVLVRTGDEDGLKLAQRIEGQASDLAVDVTAVEGAELEPAVDAQLRSADRLAADYGAEAVVWLDQVEPGHARVAAGWWLYILHPGRGRVLVRSLGKGTDPAHPDSAVLEEAALVVRSTLQALEAGAEIGVERSLVEQQQARHPPTQPTAARPGTAAARPAPALASADGIFSISAGWQIALDGISPWGQQGPTLGASHSAGIWQAGLTLAASLGSELESGPASLRFARHVAAGRIGLRTLASPWELVAGAQFGIALFTRSTTAAAPGYAPSADRSYWSWIVGPELSLSCHPPWPRLGYSIGLVAGADYVARAPEFGVGAPREFQRLDALWWVQPRSVLYADLEF